MIDRVSFWPSHIWVTVFALNIYFNSYCKLAKVTDLTLKALCNMFLRKMYFQFPVSDVVYAKLLLIFIEND